MQTYLAQELHELSGVLLGPCGIPEVKKFQAVFPGYQLNVVLEENIMATLLACLPSWLKEFFYIYIYKSIVFMISCNKTYFEKKI